MRRRTLLGIYGLKNFFLPLLEREDKPKLGIEALATLPFAVSFKLFRMKALKAQDLRSGGQKVRR